MLMSGQQLYFQKYKENNPFVVTFSSTTEILDVCERSGQIWVCGTNGFVAKSLDGGVSWTEYNLAALLGWTGSVTVVFGSHGFFPNQWRVWGANNQAAYTTNGGATWIANNMTQVPASTVTDVDDTGGFLIGCSSQGQFTVQVGGDFNGMAQTAAGDSWFTCSRDPNNATHALLGTGNKINYSVFGWPPPTGHLLGTYTKGTTATTVGGYFDNAQNLMFINADGTYGYKNQPAYSTTNPNLYSNGLLTSGTLLGLTHDRINTNSWMICGAKSGTDRMWTSTQASPHSWTELNPYVGKGVAYWNRVDRDNTRGLWITGGRTTGNVGCVGIWKV